VTAYIVCPDYMTEIFFCLQSVFERWRTSRWAGSVVSLGVARQAHPGSIPTGVTPRCCTKKISSLCLIRSRVTITARHPPAWPLQSGQFGFGPLVMGGQGSEIFSTGTCGSATS
jgi:hypothetical protein